MALREERKTKIFNDKNYIMTSYLIIISFLESITVVKKKQKVTPTITMELSK